MFKGFWLPLILTLLTIVVIETSISITRKPNFWDKTTWLLHDPYRGEPFDRLIVYEKLKQLFDEKPDIIAVGDSSGFFSIQPQIVNRYLHGLKYVSLSTGANQAFAGYKGMAEFMLKKQPSVKYVVLNMYPNLIPSKEIIRRADLAPMEYDLLASHYASITPPSASLSPYAKSLLFYHTRYDRNALPSSHKVYLELHYSIKQTLGWAPEHDIPFDKVYSTTPFYVDKEKKSETLFGLFEHSAIETTLNDFAQMCRKYHVKLMIMFNPMPWQTIVTNKDLYRAEKRLEAFSKKNPDVIFLTDRLITPWDPAKFGMYNHVSRAYVHESSARMGQALEYALFNPQYMRPFKRNWRPQQFPIPYAITPIAKASEAMKQAALAYYLYTATSQSSFSHQLSNRVRNILRSNKPFNWMMTDTRARINMLHQQGISLDYDTSKINADIVTLRNGYYCGSKKVIWIRLSGLMQFGYTSPIHRVIEPVMWPESSNVIVPIIFENNAYKFDGYCETSTNSVSKV